MARHATSALRSVASASGVLCLGLAIAMGAAGCSSRASDESSAASPSSCSVKVDSFKELIVVEPSVIDDARARNENAGAWSFRHAIESMTPPGVDASAFVLEWLRTWEDQTTFNGALLDHESRKTEMMNTVICPWLHEKPTNNCDDSCGRCTAQELDLGKAPFRLLAIVNRMDLRTKLDASSEAGEARFVFGLTSGPADNPASAARGFTAIFEYAYPKTKTVKQWAEAWLALGSHAAYDDAYKAELEGLMESIAGPNKAPERPNGSAIAQVRTNESTLNWIWQLREFRLTSGRLNIVSTKNTPLETLNGTPVLASWVAKNAQAIKADKYVVPESLLGGSANQFLFRWDLPTVDEETRRTFAAGTCNGCHSGDVEAHKSAFHVSPYASGVAKLSPFLYNPENRASDDLTRRATLHQEVLCAD